MSDIIINKLPSITWNRLNLNDAKIKNIEFTGSNSIKTEIPNEIKSEKISIIPDIKTGAGEDIDKLEKNSDILSITSSISENKIAYLTFDYNNNEKSINPVSITVEDNSSLTVIEFVTSKEDAQGFSAIQNKCNIGKNAELTLVQVHTFGKDYNIINDIGTVTKENGKFNVIQVVLGGGDTYLGIRTDLNGKKSELHTDIGYITENHKLDINYIANHIGKKTLCEINADGILRNGAEKTFKGTIDFKEGSSGSKGSERENTLLLDDDVENKTVPVILCHEEDVEGAHGATIGRLDDETLFYFESRGISEEQVYEIVARARIKAVSDKIDDERTRKYIEEYMNMSTKGDANDDE